jgi:hypothetical protein
MGVVYRASDCRSVYLPRGWTLEPWNLLSVWSMRSTVTYMKPHDPGNTEVPNFTRNFNWMSVQYSTLLRISVVLPRPNASPALTFFFSQYARKGYWVLSVYHMSGV